ncbi:MAG TPA: insulinase family protein, partial [Phycisphaerales bacterium]|nr:insulinase family protein [Phycisphaerales bacterium]
MIRRVVLSLMMLVLSAAVAPGQGMSRPDDQGGGPNPATPLPVDDRLVTGRLENGLRYIIRHHENPPGEAGIWLHVGTGSLNETDSQRGLAHFLEHMAFNGSENFPPGEVVKYFESIGLTFGRDQNAFTSFDQTAYQLYLPDTEPATIGKGLTFFADVARRLLLRQEDIDEERGVILEELRTGRGPAQRLRDQWLERLAPGSLIGVRLPIGTEESINALTRQDFLDYYNKWYVPGKMTLIVVGDLDPAEAEKQIAGAFGSLPDLPVAPDVDADVEPYTQRRAIVASDPEVTEAQVAIIEINRPDEPTTNAGTLRRDLIHMLAVEAFNRRLAAKIDAGEARMLGGGAFAQNLFGALRLAQASASSEPDAWAGALEDLVTEVRRAELHGFSDSELETARRSVLASLEQDAQQEPTYPARAILARLNNAVASGDTISSPTQILELARVLIGTVRPGEVNRAFATMFDTSKVTFLLTLPSGPGVPEEADVLALAGGFADRSPEPDADAAPAGSLMDQTPQPGEIVEQSTHPETGVWSAVLSNGVIAHHKAMSQRQNFVDVRITLLGGGVEENAENRGITTAAAQVFARPATSDLTAAQVRDLLAGKKIQVTGSAQDDFVQIAITGSPDDLETGMRLVHRLLTDPRLESVPFEQWRTATLQSMRAARRDPLGALRTVMGETIYPQEAVTARPLTPEQLERINIDDAQRWLDAFIARA